MLNVNQITSQLARMPDQSLQQYAKMHKNDPYTVSLALAESNRRKQMRDAAQGQQGMAPQPKVVDQSIAEMSYPEGQAQAMPEDVGIGALAAPNMQNFAEGGIVAFDIGGTVDAARAKEKIIRDTLRGPSGGLAYRRQQPESYAGLQTALEQAIQERELAEAAYQQGNLQTPYFGGPTDNTAFSTPSSPSVVPAASANIASSNMDRGNYPGQGSTGMQVPAPKQNLGVSTPRTPAARPATPVAANAPIAAPQDFLTQLEAMRKTRGPAVDPLRAEREAITNETVKGQQEGIAALKADQAADMAEMFKGREERVNKREAELTKSKDTNTGMAFLEAGLAMMQARGPGLAAIAQGAGIGVKQYASGIKDIKAAQEKLDDARDRIEELRQNQASMNKSAVRAEEKDLRKTVLDGKRDLLTGVKAATGVSDADFRTAVTSNIAVSEAGKQRTTTLEAARIAAAPGLARNSMLAKAMETNDKVRKDFTTLQSKVMSDLSKDMSYMSATPEAKSAMMTARLREAMLNNPFLSSYASGIGFSKTPANGTVRTLDED